MLTKIRLKKILRYGLIFFIACVIVLSGLAAWGYFFLSPLVKQRLEEVVVTQSDSLYKLQIEKLKINLLSGKIWLENVYFEPKETQWKRKFKQKNPPPFAKVYVKAIEVREWSWWAYYWHQKLQINQIIVQKADVFYQKSNQSPKDENRKPIFDEKIIEKIAKVWEINDILIEKTDVSFKIFKKDYVWTHTAKNLRLNTQKVAFNAKKWQIKGFKGGFTRYTAHTPQGDYIYHAENLGVSSFDSTLTLTYFKIIPQENPENSIKFGFKQLKLTGIQYFEVLEQQKIAFNTLKCKEVEGFFSKIPDFLAKKPTQNQPKNPNPTNDSIKKYSFLHNIPFVIAWDKIEGEKINIYVGNTPENTQNQRKINENLHFYHAKNLRFSVDKGRLDKEKSIFPKNIDLNIADLAFQKANQKAKGENLHFSLKNKSFLLENILFSNDDHTKKVQFATEKLHIKGFPTFEQMQKDIQQTKALRFGYVGITKTDINWVSDMVFGGNKSGNLLQTLPNMQVDTLYVAQFGGNISPFAHIKAKINKAEAHLYQLRKENGAFSIQNAEVKGENLCFRNQKTGDTLSAKIFQLKKNPATLMLEDWEMNVALKGMQITPTTENNTKKNSQILHIQGQKNIIQIKNLDDFISQKKYHFAYIYTKNTKFDFVLKENKDFNKKQNENITNETVTNENTILDANLNNIKPFSLPAPIEIDSLVVEKNKVSFQHLSPNNQPKSIQSCKEINAKMLKVQMEKQVSLYKLHF